MEYFSDSTGKTQEIAQEIGNKLKGGEVLALKGDLGAGKTTFMQGLAKGLGIEKNLNSPTFIIVRSYELNNMAHTIKNKVQKLIHVDLYRLENNIKQEMDNLGLMEEMSDPESVVAIEWAEKARDFLPEGTRWIEFEQLDEKKRKIIIKE